MFTNAQRIDFAISDLHLGDGVDSPIEDFKHHEPGHRIDDTDADYVLDGHFAAFCHWITENCAEKQVRLILNGDTFDPLSVKLGGKYSCLPYEDADLIKFRRIVRGHFKFFRTLKKFLARKNHRIVFIRGNHDIFLDWPKIRVELLALIAPEHPERVKFTWEDSHDGVYYRHGEAEPHDHINHEHVIIRQTDWPKLLKSEELTQLLANGRFPKNDVLDVPLGHYLTADLENPLKEREYLIGRMHIHSFVWLDAFRNIGRRSWYRSRWFALVAAYYLIKTMLGHSLFGFWHRKMKSGVRKILKVVWWTITGVLQDATTHGLALKILRERDDVDVVVVGHEHQYAVEMQQIGSRTKTYINTGTWMEQWEVAPEPPEQRWKYFNWLRRFIGFWRNFYRDAELIYHITCPVLAISWNAAGERTARLMRFDMDERTLKKL